jgi:hypothetical protein
MSRSLQLLHFVPVKLIVLRLPRSEAIGGEDEM